MTKKKILIVDDEPMFTRMVRLNLEKTGSYEVKEENDARQAFQTAEQFRPDLFVQHVAPDEQLVIVVPQHIVLPPALHALDSTPCELGIEFKALGRIVYLQTSLIHLVLFILNEHGVHACGEVFNALTH